MKSKIIAIVPAIALMLGGCAADTDGARVGVGEQKNRVTVTLSADVAATRVTTVPETEEGVTTHVPKWETGDRIAVFTTGASVNNNVEFAVGGIDVSGTAGEFTGDITVSAAGDHTFYAVYPWRGADAANNDPKAYKGEIPSIQNPRADAVDPLAYLAVASPLTVDIAAAQTTVAIEGLGFKRLGALAVINFVNTAESGASDIEKVEKVIFTVDDPSYELTGKLSADLEYAAISEFTEASNSVSAMFSDGNITLGEFSAWFVVAPGVLAAGRTVTFTILTDSSIISRQVTLGGDGLVFDIEKVARIDVTLNKKFESRTGVSLPHVFSMKAAGNSDSDGLMYSDMVMASGEEWQTFLLAPPSPHRIEANNDDSGFNVTFYKKTASNTLQNNAGVRNRVEADKILGDIMSMQMWITGDGTDYAYALFSYPVREGFSGTLYFSYCMGATNYGPKKWAVEFSTDKVNWTRCPGDFDIPSKLRNVPHFYTAPIELPRPLLRGETLFVRLIVTAYTRVNADKDADNCNEGGEIRLNAAAILHCPGNNTSDFPAGAVYTQGFDNVYGGVDYLLGEPIVNMAVYSGADFSDWSDGLKAGMTGEYVNERPGYVQIGHVAYNSIDPRNYGKAGNENNVGWLATPKLGAEAVGSDLVLTFKAMAYKSGNQTLAAINSGETYPDKDGDKQSFVVEVIGGGTIDGLVSVEKTGLSYTEFKEFSLEITGATSDTQIKFTSMADAGDFTRWFLDDICIVKK